MLQTEEDLIAEETFATWMSQPSLQGSIHGVFLSTSPFGLFTKLL